MTSLRSLSSFLLLFSLLPAGLIRAQEEDSGVSDDAGARAFWECSLPSGDFVVHLSKIASISLHEYLIPEAGVHVTEVDIDTTGSVTARFYYIEPFEVDSPSLGAQILIDRTRQLLETGQSRANLDSVVESVKKNYPTTTHAKTAEYQLTDRANLLALYEHARKVWISGRGRKFSIENS
ncbi:MAG: hypothetical protein AAF555_05510 [Verrucomicrobiota bacterium]